MTTWQLLIRSLRYYWRNQLAILLGVIVATAVIGGALVVGDSVRESLQTMSLKRLGKIDHALIGRRFFREQLADELSKDLEFAERFDAIAPALSLQAALTCKQGEEILRANRVNVFGVDERLWEMTEHGAAVVPTEQGVVLNRKVAKELNVQVGADITLWIELPSFIPRESLLGERDENTSELTLTVQGILDDELGLARLNLNPSQQLPANAFLSLSTLQQALDLAQVRPSRRDPVGAPARVNALFVSAKGDSDKTGETATNAAETLTRLTEGCADLQDFHLTLRSNTHHGYLSLESQQMLLDNSAYEAGRKAADSLNCATSPTFVYIANTVLNPQRITWEKLAEVGPKIKIKDSPGYSMYSVIAGLDITPEKPFGPWEFLGDPPKLPLADNEIVLNDWLAADLQVKVGDEIEFNYHLVGSHGELPETTRRMKVVGIVKLEGTIAADSQLTPEVKGITDVDSYGEWDQPFPMKLDLVTTRDELYWDAHRATPKAFISVACAHELWENRYGKFTSLRIAPPGGQKLDEFADVYRKQLRAGISADQFGMVFQPVKFQGVQAASGPTDFSGLFIGFSFFLIFSAMILIGLLFRLGIEHRLRNIGLLEAIGFSPAQVRNLFLAEGLLLVVLGGVLGTIAAVAYAELMVYGLRTWWVGAIGTRFLFVAVKPASLAIGFAISVLIAGLTIAWAFRAFQKISTRALLQGNTERVAETASARRGRFATTKLALATGVVALLILVAGLLNVIPDQEAFFGLSWKVVAFFVDGISLLVGSLLLLNAWLTSDRSLPIGGQGWQAIARLGLRNAARNRQRSALTVGLLACSTFVIVAVAAGHRNPAVETPDINSGNGGFTFVAESSTPLLYDLNTQAGRNRLDLLKTADAEQRQLLDSMQVFSLRVKPGENASCLNLYRTHLPTILGVPAAMIDRGGFKFAQTPGDNPWTMLNETGPNGEIPVIGDMNTMMFSLKKGLGDTLSLTLENGGEATLKIDGMLDGSVLQGVLVMSEEHFQRLFPDVDGYSYFLVETPADQATQLAHLLESKLTAYGFDVERVADRLAAFLAVQNTYLSTFLTLGGFGLLLGTFGLATVMLRNVLERRSEFALMRAVGFRQTALAEFVFWENAFLLCWGLAAGTVSALVAMLPHLLSIGADVPWEDGGVMLAMIFFVGMLSAQAAAWEAVRIPVVASLRAE